MNDDIPYFWGVSLWIPSSNGGIDKIPLSPARIDDVETLAKDDGTKCGGNIHPEKPVPDKFRHLFWSDPVSIHSAHPGAVEKRELPRGRLGTKEGPKSVVKITFQFSINQRLEWKINTAWFALVKSGLTSNEAIRPLVEQLFQRVTFLNPRESNFTPPYIISVQGISFHIDDFKPKK